MSHPLRLLAALTAAAFSTTAAAQDPPAPASAAPAPASAAPPAHSPSPSPSAPASATLPTITLTRRALAIAGSVFPGALVHGSGHYILGRPGAGSTLLLMEGIGAVTLVGSFTLLAVTGANRDLVGPTIGTAIAGGAMFGTSWLADVYGVAVPESARGAAPRSAPFLLADLGYRYVYDPQFRYRSFLVAGADARFEQVRLSPSIWQSLDDDNGRYRLLGAHRILGPTPHRLAEDGSFVDVELALTYQRYGSDGFDIATGEALANGRLDLARLDPSLRGSFAELGVGAALQNIDYGHAENALSLMLGRFAFGAYLGEPMGAGGELRFYYDHRHDDYAAGLEMVGLGSGVLGHFGLDGRWFFDGRWGIALDVQAGSAVLFGASLVMRQASLP